MSLDIAILDADGSPKKQVSIGVDDHHRLMQLASLEVDNLVSRLHDYYSDAEFGNDELETFIQDLVILRDRSQDSHLIFLLDALIELARLAESVHQPLTAIAD